MAAHIPMILLLFFFCLLGSVLGGVLFSSLPQALLVQATAKHGAVLIAGEDEITVTWDINQTRGEEVDVAYKMVKVKLCYAPISQQDRPWRMANDDLSRDKTCQFDIVVRPCSMNNKEESISWMIETKVPTATYFVRVYVINSQGNEEAFGQTTDINKTMNLLKIHGVSGRHAPLDTAVACFSAFSVVSLFGFFFLENRNARRPLEN
ncbi:hypothetical protein HHK36_025043 [Tetracentron sinense]|uniref:High-affinity nitrate transporter n=1 Tax=Tetracentron sinense TaxID=13715 RepID=A0A834YRW9_TETSI|nr:hypothetical protein HHK36_025043 [Tetracentron sinense]